MSELLKGAAAVIFLAGIGLMVAFWPKGGQEYDACRHLLGSNAWMSCLNTARTGGGLALGVALGYAFSGALLALVFLALGHIVDQLRQLTSQDDVLVDSGGPRDGDRNVAQSGDAYLDGSGGREGR